MATHDYIISNASGAAVRADLNNALAAIATNNSSATEPTTTYAYQWWADTGSSPTVMKLRNAANSGWITLFQLDGEWTVVPFENGTAAAPSIYFKDSGTDTGIYSPGTDQVAISTGGSQRLLIDSYGIVTPGGGVFSGGVSSYAVNGLVLNFSSPFSEIRACRAGGNYGGLKFYTQGANSSGAQAERMTITTEGLVGIATASPSATLDVNGVSYFRDWLTTGAASSSKGISSDSAARSLLFGINLTEVGRFDTSGRLLVGTPSAKTNFENATTTPQFQIENTTLNGASLSILRDGNDAGGPKLFLAHGRTDAGLVSNGDELGGIFFSGGDGSEFVTSASVTAAVDGTPGANDMPGRLAFSVTKDGQASPTERLRVISDGGFLAYSENQDAIRLGSSSGAGTTNSFLQAFYSATGIGANVMTGTVSIRIWSNGNVQNTNNSYTAISDIKLKENIIDANSQWHDIKSLQVRNYNFKEGQTHKQIGLIAQEVEPISPGLVYESPDRDEEGNDLGTVTKSVNYSVLYMKAVKALQEAMERIEQLEAKVAALESA